MRTLAVVALLTTLVAAPVAAQFVPQIAIFTVTAWGFGQTPAEAEQDALSKVQADYLVLNYRKISQLCHDDPLTGQFCSVQIEAKVLPKPY